MQYYLRTHILFLLMLFCFFHSSGAEQTEGELLKIVQLSPVYKEKVKALYALAELYDDDPDKKRIYLQTVLKLAQAEKKQYDVGQAYNSLGLNEEESGNYKEALQYFQNAVEVFEKLRDVKEAANNEVCIGVIHWYLGNLSKALEYYEKAYEKHKKLKNKLGQARSLGNMAIIYDDMKQKEKALATYEKALPIFIELNDSTAIASCYDNMGLVYKALRQFKEAEGYMKTALNIRSINKDEGGICASYINLGDLSLAQRKFREAIDYSSKSLEMARSIKSPIDIKFSFYNLYTAYRGLNQFEKAFDYIEKYMEIKDSIAGESKARQINELETKYKTEKKEREIIEMKRKKEIDDRNRAEKEKEHAEERKRQRLNNIMLIIVAVFIAILAIFMYWRFREKRKTAQLLEARNQEIEHQKLLVENANNELELKNRDITDSIVYASRIQDAIFPPADYIQSLLPQSFILFRPKDIVSGDFYWMDEKDDDLYFAVVDCTGHGVPGAFMSIVGFSLLKQAIHEHKKVTPAQILDQVNINLSETLRQNGINAEVKDGMDITLFKWNKKSNTYEFAAANHHVYIISNGELKSVSGDKQPIGAFMGNHIKGFTNHHLDLNKGDMLYLFTDGYADQFGGPRNKKFKYKQMEELITTLAHMPLEDQKVELATTIVNWQGEFEQNDDICIMGIRI